ncbi:MAG: response regulator transcription factor [Dehalococcoidia bacterium]|nr:response regulator transcription factor [Dehalococcoidia bacterium]
MARVLVIGSGDDGAGGLTSEVRRRGHTLLATSDVEEALSMVVRPGADVVLVDMSSGSFTSEDVKQIVHECGRKQGTSVVAIISERQLRNYDLAVGFDDFIVHPCTPLEMASRVDQALWRSGKVASESEGVSRIGDLMIDTTRYKVFLSGKPVELTFKEYELLKFLAANPDVVFSREALLNRVWGYDYFGGTRTVDVHIRRLRSKIEDAEHSFIETVRNVGYRFQMSE